jgi:hypothetical protein
MKFVRASALLISVAGLSGCAIPVADPAAGGELASMGTAYEDKGEILTGSRIPQKSTTHLLKRVGNAEYTKTRDDNSSGNVKAAEADWGTGR